MILKIMPPDISPDPNYIEPVEVVAQSTDQVDVESDEDDGEVVVGDVNRRALLTSGLVSVLTFFAGDAEAKKRKKARVAKKSPVAKSPVSVNRNGCEVDGSNPFVDLERYQRERGEVIVLSDPVYATNRNFTDAKVPGYDAPKIWIHPYHILPLQDATKLVRKKLGNEDFVIIVKDAYRPNRATTAFVDWARRTGNRHLIDDGWVAGGISGHNRGEAIDLTLGLRIGDEVREVWMGAHFDQFDPASHHGNIGNVDLPDRTQKFNYLAFGGRYVTDCNRTPLELRNVLRAAMYDVGFGSYKNEFWHYMKDLPGKTCYDKPIR